MRRPQRTRTCLLLATAVAAGGCGGGEEPVASGTIEVHAVDYAFEGLPARIAAGSTVSLVNDSDDELHELIAVRLPDDETRSVEELVALPMEELEPFFPHVTDVIVATPGATDSPGAVMGDGVLDEPGRYAVICFIPLRADAEAYMAAMASGEEPSDEGRMPPHVTEGMYAEVEVVG